MVNKEVIRMDEIQKLFSNVMRRNESGVVEYLKTKEDNNKQLREFFKAVHKIYYN